MAAHALYTYLLQDVLAEIALVKHDEDEAESAFAQLAHNLVSICLLLLREVLRYRCEWAKVTAKSVHCMRPGRVTNHGSLELLLPVLLLGELSDLGRLDDELFLVP
jgi:hypothetical protein